MFELHVLNIGARIGVSIDINQTYRAPNIGRLLDVVKRSPASRRWIGESS